MNEMNLQSNESVWNEATNNKMDHPPQEVLNPNDASIDFNNNSLKLLVDMTSRFWSQSIAHDHRQPSMITNTLPSTSYYSTVNPMSNKCSNFSNSFQQQQQSNYYNTYHHQQGQSFGNACAQTFNSSYNCATTDQHDSSAESLMMMDFSRSIDFSTYPTESSSTLSSLNQELLIQESLIQESLIQDSSAHDPSIQNPSTSINSTDKLIQCEQPITPLAPLDSLIYYSQYLKDFDPSLLALNPNEYTCTHCCEMFRDEAQLRAHLDTVHRPKSLMIQRCGGSEDESNQTSESNLSSRSIQSHGSNQSHSSIHSQETNQSHESNQTHGFIQFHRSNLPNESNSLNETNLLNNPSNESNLVSLLHGSNLLNGPNQLQRFYKSHESNRPNGFNQSHGTNQSHESIKPHGTNHPRKFPLIRQPSTNPNNPFKCADCTATFCKKPSLTTHARKNHPHSAKRCGQCCNNKRYVLQEDWIQHLRYHEKFRNDRWTYRCIVCSYSYRSKANVLGHVRAIHLVKDEYKDENPHHLIHKMSNRFNELLNKTTKDTTHERNRKLSDQDILAQYPEIMDRLASINSSGSSTKSSDSIDQFDDYPAQLDSDPSKVIYRYSIDCFDDEQ